MSLACFMDEEDLNEHEIAWRSRDWNAVKELAKQFKVPAEQSLFEIIDNVTQKRGHGTVDRFSDYDQHAINNALSQHVTMSGYASELNSMEGFISDQMHYDYLYFTVRKCSLPKVKFAKLTDDWEQRVFEYLVSDYYEVSIPRAREYIDYFSDEQIKRLKKMFSPTVNDVNARCLTVIPTKTEREKIQRAIRSW
ncbi:clamp loader subunit [Aeromonas phage Ah1]|uniref:Sliding-clamp-loader small subunit n=1 Tax=Aeromonas phage Ah1 TaxID=2053701 RepID=A0A2H4YEG0_9CAUD|nr:clamp loader of DNA polymerase [Aeromonas phage Ah1]AUE22563.1 clamp loader subunit [Aeromonas phage Ah1]UYD60055.1 sliding-clamp-loader [Aeromonas phage avDM12-TAAL]